MINSAERRKTIEIAINLLDILDDKTISEKTGLDIEIVKKIREENLQYSAKMKVEFMTLLERDREKNEEGREEERLEIAKKYEGTWN